MRFSLEAKRNAQSYTNDITVTVYESGGNIKLSIFDDEDYTEHIAVLTPKQAKQVGKALKVFGEVLDLDD
jgi:hypothetical protein